MKSITCSEVFLIINTNEVCENEEDAKRILGDFLRELNAKVDELKPMPYLFGYIKGAKLEIEEIKVN